MKRAWKFETFKDDAGEWRFRVRSGNGRIVAVGEGYKRRESSVAAYMALRDAFVSGRVRLANDAK